MIPVARFPRWLACLVVLALPRVVTQLDEGDASLRGLAGVAVLVEATSHDVWPHGLTEEWLERRVSAALRSDRIPLLARSDALGTEREPLLLVRLQTVRIPDRRAFAWHLSLAVHQRVAGLDSLATRMRAQTWAATASIGVTSAVMLRESVGETLERQVDELARAWKQDSERE